MRDLERLAELELEDATGREHARLRDLERQTGLSVKELSGDVYARHLDE